jgi:broad specificity phosphatase PhoE
VIYSPLIRELDYGRFTGKTVTETFRILNYKHAPDQRYPEGESFNDLRSRVLKFLDQLLDESVGKRVLVAAHAGSVRLMAMLLDPARQQEHLDRAYGNRYIGRAIIDGGNRLVSFEVVQNPERGGF